MGRKTLAALSLLLVPGVAVAAASALGASGSPSATVVKVAFNKTLKKSIVVDGKGWTLYMFTPDTRTTSNCTDQLIPGCARTWPPLVGAPRAGKGVAAAKLGTLKRSDGRTQASYNGHPLYYFRGPGADKKPGDVRGQGSAGLWYVLSPKGTPIRR